MDCKNCIRNLNQYVDGELEGDALKDFEQHLSECQSCKAEYNRMMKMRDLLRNLKEVEVPEGEREVFIGALRDRIEAEGVPVHISKTNWQPALVAAIAVVAVLIVLVVVPGHLRYRTPGFSEVPGLDPMASGMIDRELAMSLENHFLATSVDCFSNPALTGGQMLSVLKVMRESHREIGPPEE
jgi:hypothetical protein